jgi:hypothetical protein
LRRPDTGHRELPWDILQFGEQFQVLGLESLPLMTVVEAAKQQFEKYIFGIDEKLM